MKGELFKQVDASIERLGEAMSPEEQRREHIAELKRRRLVLERHIRKHQEVFEQETSNYRRELAALTFLLGQQGDVQHQD